VASNPIPRLFIFASFLHLDTIYSQALMMVLLKSGKLIREESILLPSLMKNSK
jgi:hypothetical protein